MNLPNSGPSVAPLTTYSSRRFVVFHLGVVTGLLVEDGSVSFSVGTVSGSVTTIAVSAVTVVDLVVVVLSMKEITSGLFYLPGAGFDRLAINDHPNSLPANLL